MPNLLVEIGTEELPVGSLDTIYAELGAKMRQKLGDEHVAFEDVTVEATPRRIAIFVKGIAAAQKDRTIEISGPSCEKCYDPQGNPTQVLQGFLKSKQATEKDIEVRESPKGKFIFLKKHEKGKAAAAILPEILKQVIASLSFPKFMRWDSAAFRFPRPIRWLVVLLDAKKVPMTISDLKSGNTSYGHRFLAPQAFKILKADWKLYIAALKKRHVHLGLEERENLVRKALEGRFAQKKIDEELVHINAHLTEEPFMLQGTFSRDYLDLPAEVLASCMKKNQKIFACYDAKGYPVDRFIAVMNGKRSGLAEIGVDYEKVLESRLKDARYFHDADTKEKLETKKGLLSQLVYLGKLGSMLEKTERIEKLAAVLAAALGKSELAGDLARAACLSKIDLMTHLVYEMPDLQGIVGREYALESGESEAVALAIGSQYLPKNLAEDHKAVAKSMTLLGALFGILDRLDLLTGAFGTGIEPTGSQDPFALRRAGGSVVKLIRAFGLHFSLAKVLEENIKLYGEKLTKKDQLKERLVKFLQERAVFETGVKPGTRPYEILQAVMRARFDDVADVFKRFETLSKMDEKVLIKAAKVIQRTANMLKGYGKTPGEPRAEAFTEEQEKRLFEIIRSKAGDVSGLIEKGEYEKGTRLFAEVFAEPIHDFFDNVLVNAEDAAVRENRMALVAAVNGLYAKKMADLSLLSRIDEE
jgi:glycyl-tRNA synthetase beta chain